MKVGANKSVNFLLIFPSQWSSTAVTWYGSENAMRYGNWSVSWEWDYTNATKPSISLSSSGTPASNITVTIKKGTDGTNNSIIKTTYSGTYKIGSTSYSISSSFTGASKTFTIKNTDYGSVLGLSISATTVAQHNKASCDKATMKVGPVAAVCNPPSVDIYGKTTPDGNTDPNAYVKVTEAKETANNPIKSTKVFVKKTIGSTTSDWSKTYEKGNLPAEIKVTNTEYDKKMTVIAYATTKPTYRSNAVSEEEYFTVGPVFKPVGKPTISIKQYGNDITVTINKGADAYLNPYVKTEYLCLVSYGNHTLVDEKHYTKDYSGSFTGSSTEFTIKVSDSNIQSGKFVYVSVKARAVGTYNSTQWSSVGLESVVLPKVSGINVVYKNSDRALFFSTYDCSYDAITFPQGVTDRKYRVTFYIVSKSGGKTLSYSVDTDNLSYAIEEVNNISEGSVIYASVRAIGMYHGKFIQGPVANSNQIVVGGNVWTKVKGAWHEGILWTKVDGTWRKESSVITKQNGIWRN